MHSSRDDYPIHYPTQASGIEVQRRTRKRTPRRAAHTGVMTNAKHTAITTWTELWESDRQVLYVSEVANLLGVDVRTVSSAIERNELPAKRMGRRLFIPRQPWLADMGITEPAS